MSAEKLPGKILHRSMSTDDIYDLCWADSDIEELHVMTPDELRQFARECFEAGENADSIDGLPFYEYVKSRGL